MEGYANLLAIQKKHAADPGDGKEMVRARARLPGGGTLRTADAGVGRTVRRPAPRAYCGCGLREGSYDRYLQDALPDARIVGFDLSKEAVRLAARKVPEAAFCVGGSFSAPVRDGWADLLLNIFSPFAGGGVPPHAASGRVSGLRGAHGPASLRPQTGALQNTL